MMMLCHRFSSTSNRMLLQGVGRASDTIGPDSMHPQVNADDIYFVTAVLGSSA